MIGLRPFFEVLKLEARELALAAKRLTHSSKQTQLHSLLNQLSRTIDTGGRVVMIGLGKSGKIAQKISATLASTGCPSFFIHPTEALHGDIGSIQSQDLIWAISYSGNSEEVARIISTLRKDGHKIIGMGGNPKSKLGRLSDYWIDAKVSKEACPHNLTPTSSTTLALALGDAIAVTLMRMRGFTAKDFKHNHPGGALGKRLTLHISDLMHPFSKIPKVTPQATMDRVIQLSTEYKLGAVLVVDGKKLKGIITDGDIRRALKHKERFFKLKAKEGMTAGPISIRETAMAAEAIKIMENRKSQISVLPVINTKGDLAGLIRLHDILQNL